MTSHGPLRWDLCVGRAASLGVGSHSIGIADHVAIQTVIYDGEGERPFKFGREVAGNDFYASTLACLRTNRSPNSSFYFKLPG